MVKEPFLGYFSGEIFAESMAQWLHLKLESLGLVNLVEKGPFVDLGCGLNIVIKNLQRGYLRMPMIGVDGSLTYLQDAQIRVPGNILVQGYLEHLPFKSESIPIMFSSKIYQLCNEKTYPEIAKEIQRTLIPGGIYFSMEDMKEYKKPFLQLGLEIIEDVSQLGGYAIFRRSTSKVNHDNQPIS